jgi:hypothetical protein
MTDDDAMPAGLVDADRTRCLCEVGSTSHWVGSVIDADGGESFWLIDQSALNIAVPVGDAHQPHEEVGPLPTAWADRIRIRDVTDSHGQEDSE